MPKCEAGCPICDSKLAKAVDFRLRHGESMTSILSWLVTQGVEAIDDDINLHADRASLPRPTEEKRPGINIPIDDSEVEIRDWRQIIPTALAGLATDFGVDLSDPIATIGQVQRTAIVIQQMTSALAILHLKDALENQDSEGAYVDAIKAYKTASETLYKLSGMRQAIDLSAAIATVERYRGGLESLVSAEPEPEDNEVEHPDTETANDFE